MTLTDAQKQTALDTLLWIVAFKGIEEGEGGKTNAQTNGNAEKGTGLRQPQAPFYNVPKNQRQSIVGILKECGSIEEIEGKYHATEKGLKRAAKETKLMVQVKERYNKYYSIVTYEENTKLNHEILYDFAGVYTDYKFNSLPIHEQAKKVFEKIYDEIDLKIKNDLLIKYSDIITYIRSKKEGYATWIKYLDSL